MDDSGNWPSKGVFSALSDLYPEIGVLYHNAWSHKDLTLGDAHLFPVNDSTCAQSMNNNKLYIALLIVQKRCAKSGYPSGIRLMNLEKSLMKVSLAAKHLQGETR